MSLGTGAEVVARGPDAVQEEHIGTLYSCQTYEQEPPLQQPVNWYMYHNTTRNSVENHSTYLTKV